MDADLAMYEAKGSGGHGFSVAGHHVAVGSGRGKT